MISIRLVIACAMFIWVSFIVLSLHWSNLGKCNVIIKKALSCEQLRGHSQMPICFQILMDIIPMAYMFSIYAIIIEMNGFFNVESNYIVDVL